MKKIILFSFALILGLTTQMQAQNEDHRFNASVSINQTLTGTFLNALIDFAETDGVGITKKSLPSTQLAFDYAIKDFLSIGIVGSYQTIGFDAMDATYRDTNGDIQLEDYNLTLKRTSIGLRPLFHYSRNERLDMYSGLRVQYFISDLDSDSKDPDRVQDFLDETDFDEVNKIAVSIVAFGLRYYFTDNIGIGTEINLGRPYIVNFSVNARF